jgi:phospholipid/cholesterol/gamma-HCH transport system substrate-binding protein
MAGTRTEILTGALVLAVAAGFLVYANRGGPLFDQTATYPLRASFQSVEGVSVGSDIRLAGVKVGAITGLALNPQTFFADATLSIAAGVELPADSAIVISSEGLLGGQYVEILPGGAVEVLAPGDEIEDTQGSVSIVNLLMKFAGGSGDAGGGDAGSE